MFDPSARKMDDDEDERFQRTTAGQWKWDRNTVYGLAVDRHQWLGRGVRAAKPANETPANNENKTNLYTNSLEEKLDPTGDAAVERPRCVRCSATPPHLLPR